ncbi:hypothetical protein [Deinococcus xianganensis]|uniref:Uncharacterized protein n=1 Tax=Deinococcus xianganensis TaxID=1507289 RepID=A0A6I4YPB0_9DEIO|nr:hypothetical protein [Deinococcus xianganensis]MXV21684.1 hypothetical protein [Deinococcus xianganensis]
MSAKPRGTHEHLAQHQVHTTEAARKLAAQRQGGPRGEGRRLSVTGQPTDWTQIDAHLKGKSTQEQARALMGLLRAGLAAPISGPTVKKAWTDSVLAGINGRRVASGKPWFDGMNEAASAARRIKVVLPDGTGVYFRNLMTDVGSPSFDSPYLIINGEDEHGQPLRVQVHALDAMTLVFE